MNYPHSRIIILIPAMLMGLLVVLTTVSNTYALTVQVNYNGSSFSPPVVTIQPNDTVTWTNQSTNFLELSSDPHPIHTDYPPLNLGLINSGTSKSLTFPTVGSYGYHNHLQPSATGTVIVQITASPSPNPATLLKTLLTDYLSANNSYIADGKINMLDAAVVLQQLTPP